MLESRRNDLCIIVQRKITRNVLLAARHTYKITEAKSMISARDFGADLHLHLVADMRLPFERSRDAWAAGISD